MYINSIGHYIPSRRIDNDYFYDVNGLTADWIVQRTGIYTRSRAGENENVNTMAFEAVENGLKRLPYDISKVDLVVAAAYCIYDTVATVGHEVQRHFDIDGAKVVCATSACSSFINGLEIIEGYFASGKSQRALLVCSEENSYYANEKNPKDGHLWGDAAVAYFISKEKMADDDIKIETIFTKGLGNLGKGPGGVMLRPKEGGISMPDGRDVFIYACRYMVNALQNALEQAHLSKDDIHHFICHQANKRIVAQVAHQLEVPLDNFWNNIEELGNTGSASAALVLAQRKEDFKPGERIALMVFGGGYSCGCFIISR